MSYQSPLRLNDLFVKGTVRSIHFESYGGVLRNEGPPRGKRWMILGGTIYSAGANAFALYIRARDGKLLYLLGTRTTGGAGRHPLFTTDAAEDNAQWSPLVVTDEMEISGALIAGDSIQVEVIEW